MNSPDHPLAQIGVEHVKVFVTVDEDAADFAAVETPAGPQFEGFCTSCGRSLWSDDGRTEPIRCPKCQSGLERIWRDLFP